jgi:hypothetical protein
VRPRTTLLLPIVALLGAVAVMVGALAGAPQALAAPSEVKLEVAEHCYFAKWPCWNVKGNDPSDIREIQPFTIAQGGTISFEDNEASYPTDLIWKGTGTPPSCTSKVPSTPETGWSGTCTFTNAGDYEFESQDLFNEDGFNYTQYKVIVKAPGAPVVSTGMASAVDETEAALQAAVDPEGKETKYFFEWGTSSTSYEHATAAVTLGFQDTSSHDVSASLSDLAPETVYHFRIVAKNQTETVMGADETFTTPSPSPPSQPPPPPPNTPSPISSPVGGNPIAITSTTSPAPSQGPTMGPPVVPPTALSTEKVTKPLTQAQKLAMALKQCKKQPKKKRAQCETKARKLYAPKHKSHKK